MEPATYAVEWFDFAHRETVGDEDTTVTEDSGRVHGAVLRGSGGAVREEDLGHDVTR
jgi:hypothetical protein